MAAAYVSIHKSVASECNRYFLDLSVIEYSKMVSQIK